MYEHIMQLAYKAGYHSASALCAAAGVTRSTLTELKKGRHITISRKNAERLCKALGCTMDEFYMYEHNDDEMLNFSTVERVMLLAEQLDDADLLKVISKASALLQRRNNE